MMYIDPAYLVLASALQQHVSKNPNVVKVLDCSLLPFGWSGGPLKDEAPCDPFRIVYIPAGLDSQWLDSYELQIKEILISSLHLLESQSNGAPLETVHEFLSKQVRGAVLKGTLQCMDLTKSRASGFVSVKTACATGSDGLLQDELTNQVQHGAIEGGRGVGRRGDHCHGGGGGDEQKHACASDLCSNKKHQHDAIEIERGGGGRGGDYGGGSKSAHAGNVCSNTAALMQWLAPADFALKGEGNLKNLCKTLRIDPVPLGKGHSVTVFQACSADGHHALHVPFDRNNLLPGFELLSQHQRQNFSSPHVIRAHGICKVC